MPERAIEAEDLRPDRLARRIADADAREPEAVLQRAVDQDIAEPVDQPRRQRHRLLVENLLAPFARVIDEEVEHARA